MKAELTPDPESKNFFYLKLLPENEGERENLKGLASLIEEINKDWQDPYIGNPIGCVDTDNNGALTILIGI